MKSSKFHSRCSRLQRGVGMIEVLVTFVIVSVGMLAIVGMQITGKQANYDAVQRTAASHLAMDMMERMRLNPTGLAGYATNTVLGGNTVATPNPACAAVGSSCTPTQLAAADLDDWEELLDGLAEWVDADSDDTVDAGERATGGLVNPRACVIGPAGGGTGLYRIFIVWRGSQEQATAALGGGVCGGGLDNTNLYGTVADASSNDLRRIVRISFFVVV